MSARCKKNMSCGIIFIFPFLPLFVIIHGLENSAIAETVSHQLEIRLTQLVNSSLEIPALEDIYETKTRLVKRDFNTREVLHDMVGNMSERLGGVVDILNVNRDYIETSYINNTFNNGTITTTCCNGKNIHFDARFMLVNSYKTCFCSQNKDVPSVRFKDIDVLYRKNLDDSLILLWQYFGDSNGNYQQFPRKRRFCSSFDSTDHRFKDWYVFTASPQKKNVVIVVDESGSMSIPNGGFQNPNTTLRVEIAKEAAITVLETLSPSDHVGVVAFSNNPRSPSGCLGTKVTKATVENKKALQDFLRHIKPKQDTFYGKAFTSAFSLLREAKQQTPIQFEDSVDVILFLTDGTPSESSVDEILEDIAKGQNSMNNTVQIFVYGFGKEILSSKYKSKTDLLLKIADQNNQKMSGMFGIVGGASLQWPKLVSVQDITKPLGPVGNLTILPDVDEEQLRNVMGSYYTKFPMSQHTDYTVSLPHIEDNLGLVITLGIPTLDKNGEFFGVAAIDISVELTFYEVINFRQGQHSYGFIIGNDGKVLVHPYMADPHKLLVQPRYYNVIQIEPTLNDEAIFNITHGIPGLFYSIGARYWRKSEMFSTETKPATFYYEPILGFHGNYTAVLVIFDEDIERLKADQDIEEGDFPEFIYHRIDFYDNDTSLTSDLCGRGDTFVLQNNATVKFAPNVYSNPMKSLEFEQTNNKSYPLYQHYKNARLFAQNADIHQDASNDIVLTNITDQLWKRDDIIWRYLGTENGFFKIFPGTMLSDVHYDPRDDLWYRKSYDSPNKYIFIDGGNSTYITMAKVFHQSSNGSVSGVAAADISRRQFSVIIRNLLTRCKHCYILDDTGYVLEQWNATGLHVKKHITELAGPASDVLRKKGFLKSEICMDATSNVKKLSYSLDLDGHWSVVRHIGCHDFILISINNTNLFLLKYQPDNCMTLNVGTCSCTEKCLLCDDHMESRCQCPCTCTNKKIDECKMNFTVTQGYTPCKEKERHWKTVKTLELKKSNISKCQPNCPSLMNDNECQSVPGCVWCTTGVYKYIPMCTQSCVVDRVQIDLKAPCSNLSNLLDVQRQTLVANLSRSIQTDINDANLIIGTPVITHEGTVRFNISTKDETSVPDNWTDILSKPVYMTNDIVLIHGEHIDHYSSLQVLLTFNNVNFSKELETELTLRDYIEIQVKEFIMQALNDKAVVVSEIWPEEDAISFFLSTSSVHDAVVRQMRMWNTSSLPVLDIFGRTLNLMNVSVDNSYNSLCDIPCDNVLSQKECNTVPGCHWDVLSHGVCTNNSLLPERIQSTVYMPCFGLYSNWTIPNIEVTKSFQEMLITRIPSLDQSMLQLHVVKDDALIGRQIELKIQGRVNSLPVTYIWWELQQLVGHNTTVSVNGTEYYMSLHPTTYQQFTNMHITLTMEGLDIDTVLHQHALDGREEIRHSIIHMIKLYLRPQVVRNLGNLKISMDEVTFSVDNHNDNTIDLRSEYDVLQTAVSAGNVTMTIYKHNYLVKDIIFIGSFDQLCPRTCDEGTQSTCDSIPGCDWSDLNHCSSEVIFPERMNVSVVFPCTENITDPVTDHIVLETKKHFTDYYRTKTTSDVISTSTLRKNIMTEVSVTLQATSRSPSLSTLYGDGVQWLKKNKLHLKVDNSSYTGISDIDYSRLSAAIEYSNINFTTETIKRRTTIIKELGMRIKLILSEGVDIENIWLTLNYSVFEITKQRTNLHSNDLSQELAKIEQFVQLGGLTFNFNGTEVTPKYIHSHGYTECQQCSLSNQHCKRPCFWMGEWNIHYCDLSYKNPDKLNFEVLLPCNQTQMLTSVDRKESVKSLHRKAVKLLHPAGQYVVSFVDITETGATIGLQSTPLHPYLEKYLELLHQSINYRTRFTFGPQYTSLVPAQKEDYTNVKVELHFKSIDFDAVVNSGLASYKQISMLLRKQINTFLLGEIAQSYQIMKIENDCIQFTLKKDIDSHIDMSREIIKLKDLVEENSLHIDINYIRPVKATTISVYGNFDDLCKDLAGHVTGSTILPTFASNITKPQIPVAMIPIPSITILYDKSTASEQNLMTVIHTQYVDVCFVEVNKGPACLSSFSTKTCSFKNDVTKEKMAPKSDPDHIGPLQWTIISVGGIFVLALALWAIQGIHAMTKKEKPPTQAATSKCSIEDTE